MNKTIAKVLPQLPSGYFWCVTPAPGYDTARSLTINKKIVGTFISKEVMEDIVYIHYHDSNIQQAFQDKAKYMYEQFTKRYLIDIDGVYK